MKTTTPSLPSPTLHDRFYHPVALALSRAIPTRLCHDYSDWHYLQSGVGRIIESSRSGREWVQLFNALIANAISVGNFFKALNSNRRLSLLEEIAEDVRQQTHQQAGCRRDPFAAHPELAGYVIYATDGHSHGASAHEEPIGGQKRSVTHLFSLNLRTHTLAHLALTQPQQGKKKEHELSTIKRKGGHVLRVRTPKGAKVIHAYDPAITDYPEWYKWKHGHGIYIITREKVSSALMIIGQRDWDRQDPRNTGVLSDESVGPSNGVSMRRIRYQDPASGEIYTFLTNEFDLPPGLIVLIYRLRWDVEKVFDEIKNKLGQQKAWGKSQAAKQQQALFITLAHNLLLFLELTLEAEEGIIDEKVRHKQQERLNQEAQRARKPTAFLTHWSSSSYEPRREACNSSAGYATA